jgi:hypothetical protein
MKGDGIDEMTTTRKNLATVAAQAAAALLACVGTVAALMIPVITAL